MKLLIYITALVTIVSCATIGNTFKDEDIEKLQPGMSESEVIAILKVEPSSRTYYSNGNYLLQWMYSYGTFVGVAGSRHVAILFDPDKRMLKIVHQTKIGPGLKK